MSFILDALKRSERERGKVTDGPVPVAGSARGGAGLTVTRIVVLILLVNAVLAGLWWWWRGGATSPPAARVTAPAPVPTAPPAIEAAPAAAVAAGVARGPEPPAPQAAPVPPAAFTLPPSPPPSSVVLDPRVVPYLSQLPADFQRALPPMTVNIHVYVPDESARLLFINNRQVQKGEWLAAGVRLEDIVADGAVLSFQGVKFKLPRPR